MDASDIQGRAARRSALKFSATGGIKPLQASMENNTPPGRHGRPGQRQQRGPHPAEAETDRRQDPAGHRGGAEAHRERHLRHLPRLRRADRRGAPQRHPVDAGLHHLQGKAERRDATSLAAPQEFYREKLALLQRHQAGARIVSSTTPTTPTSTSSTARRRTCPGSARPSRNSAAGRRRRRAGTHAVRARADAPAPRDRRRRARRAGVRRALAVARRTDDRRPPPRACCASSSASRSSRSASSSRRSPAATDLLGRRADVVGPRTAKCCRRAGSSSRRRDRPRLEPGRPRRAPRLRRLPAPRRLLTTCSSPATTPNRRGRWEAATLSECRRRRPHLSRRGPARTRSRSSRTRPERPHVTRRARSTSI